MKNKIIFKLMIFGSILCGSVLNAQNVTFADPAFKNYLLENSTLLLDGTYGFIDADGDGEINILEAENVGQLEIYDQSPALIVDLTGIEAFTNLYVLGIYDVGVTSLNISNLTNLDELNFNNCMALSSINLSSTANLRTFSAFNCSFSTIDFTSSTTLEIVSIGNCDLLTSINLSGLTLLTYVSIYDLDLLNNLNLLNTPILYSFSMGNCNAITGLDIQNHDYLTQFSCISNNVLQNVNVSGCSNLQSLDIQNNALTDLNLTGNTALRYLNASNNQLATIDLSTLVNLYIIEISNNQLTFLDFSAVQNLSEIKANNNPLTAINYGTSTYIYKIGFKDTNFTTFDTTNLGLNYLAHLKISGPNLLNINIINAPRIYSIEIKNAPVLTSAVILNNYISVYLINSSVSLILEDAPNLLYICTHFRNVENFRNSVLWGSGIVNPNCIVNSYCEPFSLATIQNTIPETNPVGMILKIQEITPNTTSTIGYTINGGTVQYFTDVESDYYGRATVTYPATAINGQVLNLVSIARTDIAGQPTYSTSSNSLIFNEIGRAHV